MFTLRDSADPVNKDGPIKQIRTKSDLSKLPTARFRSGPGGWGVVRRRGSFLGKSLSLKLQAICGIPLPDLIVTIGYLS